MDRQEMTKELWGNICETLRNTIGAGNFANWIEPLEFVEVSDGVAQFVAPTCFYGNYVTQNYADQILYLFRRLDVPAERLSFRIRPTAAAMRPAMSKQAAPTAPTKSAKTKTDSAPAARSSYAEDGMLPDSQLDPRYTFDNFVVGKPNELAHAAARRVAEGGPVTFNPLFLYGGVGLGKTHLMHAVAHELRRRDPNLNVVYLSAEQFMYRFISALKDRRMIDFKQMFRSVDVLMVDDVQFIAGKDSTQEEFFHTFNALVESRKQIIISADRAPGEIKDLEDRIKSRLQCGLVVDLHPTDFELRMGILQTKAEMFHSQFPGLEIEDGVLEFLAHRISSNVRVLEGALNRLFAMASLVGKPITLDMTQDCLADLLKSTDRRVTIDEIQRAVAEHFNIRLSDLVGPKRLRAYARPRQVAMWLAKRLTNRSLPEIGRKFGGRDHTTVMHGVRRIDELREADSQLSDELELLRRTLSS